MQFDMPPWQILEIEHNASVSQVRQSYASLIKKYRPDTHPQEFSRIRQAYEAMLVVARHGHMTWLDAAALEELPVVQIPQVPVESDLPPVRITAPFSVDEQTSSEHFIKIDPDSTLMQEFETLQHQSEQTDEEDLLRSLRALLRQSNWATIDDRQAFEAVLLRWFLGPTEPFMLLLFEAARVFEWHGRADHLIHILDSNAIDRLEKLLTLSRDVVFARYFAKNAWVHRLVDPGVRTVPFFALTSEINAACAWRKHWKIMRSRLEFSPFFAQTSPAVTKRLSGAVMRSTDLLVGLLMVLIWKGELVQILNSMWTYRPVFVGGVLFFLVSLLAGAGVAVLRYTMVCIQDNLALLPKLSWVLLIPSHLKRGGIYSWVILWVVILQLLQVKKQSWMGVGTTFLGWGVVMYLAWISMFFIERWAFYLLLWREAVDRWEFKKMLESPPDFTAKPNAPLFGKRASIWQRFRSIRQALAHEATEINNGQRPVR
jgi:hypothetical protein